MEPPATTARAGHQAGGRQAGPRLAQRRWASTCPAPAPSRGIRRAKTPGPARPASHPVAAPFRILDVRNPRRLDLCG